MFRPMTYAPRGRMSQSAAVASASLARSSPRCQAWSSRPRLPSGSSRLWSGPATNPSSEIDMWQVVSGIGVLPRWLRSASGDSTLVQARSTPDTRRLGAAPRSVLPAQEVISRPAQGGAAGPRCMTSTPTGQEPDDAAVALGVRACGDAGDGGFRGRCPRADLLAQLPGPGARPGRRERPPRRHGPARRLDLCRVLRRPDPDALDDRGS